MSKLLLSLLIFIMPLQAFAAQGSLTLRATDILSSTDPHHSFLASHHHESDGSVHFDESAESAEHAAEMIGCNVAADLLFVKVDIDAPISVNLCLTKASPLLSDGFLDCPQRPPSILHKI